MSGIAGLSTVSWLPDAQQLRAQYLPGSWAPAHRLSSPLDGCHRGRPPWHGPPRQPAPPALDPGQDTVSDTEVLQTLGRPAAGCVAGL
eukprot:365906-Chlamydomonas_euryale.AAC.23